MHAGKSVLWLPIMVAALLPGSATGDDLDDTIGSRPVKTVRYDPPRVESTAKGGSIRTYVGRGDKGEPRVHQIVEIPAGWTFVDLSSLIRVRGTCVHEATGFEVGLVTQVDEGHFCRTHVAATVVEEGIKDGVPYCILELKNAREWTTQQRILADNDLDTVQAVESMSGDTLPPKGSSIVHFSFQIPHATGWLAAAEVVTDDERVLMEDLVLSGLRVSFQDPYADQSRHAVPRPKTD